MGLNGRLISSMLMMSQVVWTKKSESKLSVTHSLTGCSFQFLLYVTSLPIHPSIQSYLFAVYIFVHTQRLWSETCDSLSLTFLFPLCHYCSVVCHHLIVHVTLWFTHSVCCLFLSIRGAHSSFIISTFPMSALCSLSSQPTLWKLRFPIGGARYPGGFTCI